MYWRLESLGEGGGEGEGAGGSPKLMLKRHNH